MIEVKAHCADHAKHRTACGSCIDAEMARIVARDYPESILGPWRERVTEAQLALVEPLNGGWLPSMRRWTGPPATYVLRRNGMTDSIKDTTYSIEIAGGDWKDVLSRAYHFDLVHG
jgi:hypothetical protein